MSVSNPLWQTPKPMPAPMEGTSSEEWRYEMRREAQKIIPQLYLGPFQAATNADKLRAKGITHILCIRDKKEASVVKPRFPELFTYLTLDISDRTDQNIITIFPQCRAFIDDAISRGCTVLVHCNGGIAVSPAIVIGYLMWKFNWTYDNALIYVQTRRYCVSPSSFHIQLKEYEPIAIAQKMMEQAAVQHTVHGGDGNGKARAKRVMEEDTDEVENGAEETDRRRGRFGSVDEYNDLVNDGMDLS